MDLGSMKRRELQALCKQHGIPAHGATAALAARLAATLPGTGGGVEAVAAVRRGVLKGSGSGSSREGAAVAKKVSFSLDQPVREEVGRGRRRSVVWSPVVEKAAKAGVSGRAARSRSAAAAVVSSSPVVGKKRGRREAQVLCSGSEQPVITEEKGTEVEFSGRSTRSGGWAAAVVPSPVVERKRWRRKEEALGSGSKEATVVEEKPAKVEVSGRVTRSGSGAAAVLSPPVMEKKKGRGRMQGVRLGAEQLIVKEEKAANVQASPRITRSGSAAATAVSPPVIEKKRGRRKADSVNSGSEQPMVVEGRGTKVEVSGRTTRSSAVPATVASSLVIGKKRAGRKKMEDVPSDSEQPMKGEKAANVRVSARTTRSSSVADTTVLPPVIGKKRGRRKADGVHSGSKERMVLEDKGANVEVSGRTTRSRAVAPTVVLSPVLEKKRGGRRKAEVVCSDREQPMVVGEREKAAKVEILRRTTRSSSALNTVVLSPVIKKRGGRKVKDERSGGELPVVVEVPGEDTSVSRSLRSRALVVEGKHNTKDATPTGKKLEKEEKHGRQATRKRPRLASSAEEEAAQEHVAVRRRITRNTAKVAVDAGDIAFYGPSGKVSSTGKHPEVMEPARRLTRRSVVPALLHKGTKGRRLTRKSVGSASLNKETGPDKIVGKKELVSAKRLHAKKKPVIVESVRSPRKCGGPAVFEKKTKNADKMVRGEKFGTRANKSQTSTPSREVEYNGSMRRSTRSASRKHKAGEGSKRSRKNKTAAIEISSSLAQNSLNTEIREGRNFRTQQNVGTPKKSGNKVLLKADSPNAVVSAEALQSNEKPERPQQQSRRKGSRGRPAKMRKTTTSEKAAITTEELKANSMVIREATQENEVTNQNREEPCTNSHGATQDNDMEGQQNSSNMNEEIHVLEARDLQNSGPNQENSKLTVVENEDQHIQAEKCGDIQTGNCASSEDGVGALDQSLGIVGEVPLTSVAIVSENKMAVDEDAREPGTQTTDDTVGAFDKLRSIAEAVPTTSGAVNLEGDASVQEDAKEVGVKDTEDFQTLNAASSKDNLAVSHKFPGPARVPSSAVDDSPAEGDTNETGVKNTDAPLSPSVAGSLLEQCSTDQLPSPAEVPCTSAAVALESDALAEADTDETGMKNTEPHPIYSESVSVDTQRQSEDLNMQDHNGEVGPVGVASGRGSHVDDKDSEVTPAENEVSAHIVVADAESGLAGGRSSISANSPNCEDTGGEEANISSLIHSDIEPAEADERLLEPSVDLGPAISSPLHRRSPDNHEDHLVRVEIVPSNLADSSEANASASQFGKVTGPIPAVPAPDATLPVDESAYSSKICGEEPGAAEKKDFHCAVLSGTPSKQHEFFSVVPNAEDLPSLQGYSNNSNNNDTVSCDLTIGGHEERILTASPVAAQKMVSDNANVDESGLKASADVDSSDCLPTEYLQDDGDHTHGKQVDLLSEDLAPDTKASVTGCSETYLQVVEVAVAGDNEVHVSPTSEKGVSDGGIDSSETGAHPYSSSIEKALEGHSENCQSLDTDKGLDLRAKDQEIKHQAVDTELSAPSIMDNEVGEDNCGAASDILDKEIINLDNVPGEANREISLTGKYEAAGSHKDEFPVPSDSLDIQKQDNLVDSSIIQKQVDLLSEDLTPDTKASVTGCSETSLQVVEVAVAGDIEVHVSPTSEKGLSDDGGFDSSETGAHPYSSSIEKALGGHSENCQSLDTDKGLDLRAKDQEIKHQAVDTELSAPSIMDNEVGEDSCGAASDVPDKEITNLDNVPGEANREISLTGKYEAAGSHKDEFPVPSDGLDIQKQDNLVDSSIIQKQIDLLSEDLAPDTKASVTGCSETSLQVVEVAVAGDNEVHVAPTSEKGVSDDGGFGSSETGAHPYSSSIEKALGGHSEYCQSFDTDEGLDLRAKDQEIKHQAVDTDLSTPSIMDNEVGEDSCGAASDVLDKEITNLDNVPGEANREISLTGKYEAARSHNDEFPVPSDGLDIQKQDNLVESSIIEKAYDDFEPDQVKFGNITVSVEDYGTYSKKSTVEAASTSEQSNAADGIEIMEEKFAKDTVPDEKVPGQEVGSIDIERRTVLSYSGSDAIHNSGGLREVAGILSSQNLHSEGTGEDVYISPQEELDAYSGDHACVEDKDSEENAVGCIKNEEIERRQTETSSAEPTEGDSFFSLAALFAEETKESSLTYDDFPAQKFDYHNESGNRTTAALQPESECFRHLEDEQLAEDDSYKKVSLEQDDEQEAKNDLEGCSSNQRRSSLGLQSLFVQESMSDSMRNDVLPLARVHCESITVDEAKDNPIECGVENTTILQPGSDQSPHEDGDVDENRDCIMVAIQQDNEKEGSYQGEGFVVLGPQLHSMDDLKHREREIVGGEMARKEEKHVMLMPFSDYKGIHEELDVREPAQHACAVTEAKVCCPHIAAVHEEADLGRSSSLTNSLDKERKNGLNIFQLESKGDGAVTCPYVAASREHALEECIGFLSSEALCGSCDEQCNEQSTECCTPGKVGIPAAEEYKAVLTLPPSVDTLPLSDEQHDSELEGKEFEQCSFYWDEDLSDICDIGSIP